jgi:hypothetical protein
MAIRRLIASGSFEPEQSAAMISAYDAACTVLRLTDIDDPLTELIATAIVEVASTGERDPILLAGKALVALGLREPPG